MTGPKQIRTRRNRTSRARTKAPENRGGARDQSANKKKPPKARTDMRDLLIERLEYTQEHPKELGKHWIDHIIVRWKDPRTCQTTSGMKWFADMTSMLFYEPKKFPSVSRPQTEEPGDSKSAEKIGETGLPPLAPDPAKAKAAT